MTDVEAHGLAAEVRAGWEVEIYRRPVGEAPPAPGSSAAGAMPSSAQAPPILHLANFALPAQRGDYGGGAVELMDRGNFFISLLEHEPAEAGATLFRHAGVPWPLAASDFSPAEMQRTISGQSGCQRFFTVGSRPFCLYVALGSHAMRALLVGEVNKALATIRID